MSNTTAADITLYVGEELPYHALVIFIVVGILYIILGVVGNTVIIVTVIKTKSMHNPHYYFIVNLAIADLIITGYVITWTVVGLILGNYPVTSFDNCIFNGMLIVCAYVASLDTLMVISINRYLNICHRHLFAKIFSRKLLSSIAYCSLIWIFAVLVTLPPLLGWGRYHFDEKTHYCGYDRTYRFSFTLFLMLASIGFPVGIVFACNFAIWRFVRQSSHKIRDTVGVIRRVDSTEKTTSATTTATQLSTAASSVSTPSPKATAPLKRAAATAATARMFMVVSENEEYSSTEEPMDGVPDDHQARSTTKSMLSPGLLAPPASTTAAVFTTEAPRPTPPGPDKEARKINPMSKLVTADELALIKSLFVVFVCFAVLMTPYMMATLIDTKDQWSSVIHVTCSFTSFTNSCINWIVYGLMNKKFRQAYRKLLCSGFISRMRLKGRSEVGSGATGVDARESRS